MRAGDQPSSSASNEAARRRALSLILTESKQCAAQQKISEPDALLCACGEDDLSGNVGRVRRKRVAQTLARICELNDFARAAAVEIKKVRNDFAF